SCRPPVGGNGLRDARRSIGCCVSCRRPTAGRPLAHIQFFTCLVARVTGGSFPDLLQNAAEVVRFGGLQRRVLFVRQQVPQPQLLTDGQHVPVVLEGG